MHVVCHMWYVRGGVCCHMVLGTLRVIKSFCAAHVLQLNLILQVSGMYIGDDIMLQPCPVPASVGRARSVFLGGNVLVMLPQFALHSSVGTCVSSDHTHC